MPIETLHKLWLQTWKEHPERVRGEPAAEGTHPAVLQERKYARAETLRPAQWKHERFALLNPFDGPFRRFAERFPVELRENTILCTGQTFGPDELFRHRHALWFRIGLGDSAGYAGTDPTRSGHTFVMRTTRRLRLVPWTGQGVYPTRSEDKHRRLEYGRAFGRFHLEGLLQTQPWARHVPNRFGDIHDALLREVASRMYPGFDGMVAYVKRLQMYEVILFDVVEAGMTVLQADRQMSQEDMYRLRDPSINPSRTLRWWHDAPARRRLWRAKVPTVQEELFADEHENNMQTDEDDE